MSWYAKRFEPYPTKTRVECVICARPLWLPKCKVGKYVTCGDECAAKRLSAARNNRARQCAICGNTFTPRQGQLAAGQGKYCSIACRGLAPMDQLFAPGVAQRAQEARRARIAAGLTVFKSGPDNPQWKGGAHSAGARAARKRRLERMKAPHKVPLHCLATNRLIEQDGRCAMCGEQLADYHFDHVMPLALGGEHKWENICLLCPPCNRRKGAKHPDQIRWAIRP